jgi:hypothetical protein
MSIQTTQIFQLLTRLRYWNNKIFVNIDYVLFISNALLFQIYFDIETYPERIRTQETMNTYAQVYSFLVTKFPALCEIQNTHYSDHRRSS